MTGHLSGITQKKTNGSNGKAYCSCLLPFLQNNKKDSSNGKL